MSKKIDMERYLQTSDEYRMRTALVTRLQLVCTCRAYTEQTMSSTIPERR